MDGTVVLLVLEKVAAMAASFWACKWFLPRYKLEARLVFSGGSYERSSRLGILLHCTIAPHADDHHGRRPREGEREKQREGGRRGVGRGREREEAKHEKKCNVPPRFEIHYLMVSHGLLRCILDCRKRRTAQDLATEGNIV